MAALGLAGCGEVYGFPSPAQENPLEALLRQQQQQQAPLPPADPAAMAAFLETNKKAPGVRTTASGMQYKVVQSGPAGGASPVLGDTVKVNYKGTLTDGTEFDASQPGTPSEFQVGQLVDGFNEALTMMKPGDKWMVYIPANIGYGAEQRGQIPAGSVLVFELELVSTLPATPPTAEG